MTDANNRDGKQFDIARDGETGLLSVVGNVDPTKLSSSEKALYDSINNTDATGTLTVVPSDSHADFEKATGKGHNTLDRSDLNALGAADKRLPAEVIAHAAVESYNSDKKGVSVEDAHLIASKSFGFNPGYFTPNWGGTVKTLSISWHSKRLGINFRVHTDVVTPIPRATWNQMVGDHSPPPARNVTNVEILSGKQQ